MVTNRGLGGLSHQLLFRISIGPLVHPLGGHHLLKVTHHTALLYVTGGLLLLNNSLFSLIRKFLLNVLEVIDVGLWLALRDCRLH
jgi:hypothetical protein